MSLLGIDLGTSGVKCAAYNEAGKVLGKTYREYMLYTPGEGIVELDPDTVWENLYLNLKELNTFPLVIKDPVAALSISVSGDEALPVDKKGSPLYNTIMSSDKRGLKENNYINSIIKIDEVYEITGQPPSHMYALNRLIWFRDNRPDIFEKIYKFLCWEGYIFLKFGAEPSTDYSVACRTLAFDIMDKKWSDKILEKVKINKDLFPQAHPSGSEIGSINKSLASELGFKKDVKIVTGGFDQICAALGAGIVKGGMASVGTGSVESMHVCFNTPIRSSQMLSCGYPFCNHALGSLYIALSINLSGGVMFKWYRDNFSKDEILITKKHKLNVYDVIMDSAIKSKYPVLFLPYFEGAQTPRNNSYSSGSMLGLSLRTTREDIIKGMLEGITFDLRLNLEMLEEAGTKIEALRATGGGARSDTWLQIKADITGKLIQKIDVDESGCMAVAILAGFGIGKFDSIEKVLKKWVKIGKEFEPDMKKYIKYQAKYEQWLEVYNNLEKFKIIH
jgi:Sugar (pentulose and hexulose) kinases